MNRIKILLTAAFAAAAATAVISCNNPSLEDRLTDSADEKNRTSAPFNNLPAEGGQASFKARYFDGNYLPYDMQPAIAVISSKTELEQEFGEQNYRLFEDSTAKYTDDFFAKNFLVVVAFSTPSISFKHYVERIDENGNIIINRLTPEVHLTAVGGWTAIIELNNDSKLERYNAVINTIKFNDVDSVKYIYGVGGRKTGATVIFSRTELEQYYGAYLTHPRVDTMIAKYTDEFFKKDFIIIVSLTTPHSAATYKVETIRGPGDIHITQFEGNGADVEGAITIIIERNNHFKNNEYNVIINRVNAPPPPQSYDFGHQYIHGYYSNRENNNYDNVYPHQPVIDVVSSKTELERNFNRSKDGGGIVADSIAKYTDGFFTNNFLVIVSFTEGCNYFDGAKLAVQRDGVDDGKIVINRLIPAELACATVLDAWTVIIPMRNEYKLKEYKAEVNEVVIYPPDVPQPSYDLSVRYVPMGWVSGVPYPQITTISSGWELSQYYKEVTSQVPGFPEKFMYNDSLADAFRKYTSAPNFFNDNFLIVVSLEARSGGTRHKVEKVDANGDIHINRVILGSTADMAAWDIIIPQSKNSKLEKYRVVLDGAYLIRVIPAIMELEPEAQYIRTGSVLGNAEGPVVISSPSELERYDLSIPNIHISSDGVVSNVFTDNISKYTYDFFRTNFLVIVPKGEGSGSVRHKVEAVDYSTGKIVISRLLPDFGTDDIAGWHIVIELKKEYKASKEYKAVFVDKSI